MQAGGFHPPAGSVGQARAAAAVERGSRRFFTMRLELPYVCEFCHAPTKVINWMDVSEPDEEMVPADLMMVCVTCKDVILQLADAINACDDDELQFDLQADEIFTHDSELRRVWDLLRARRRRF